MLELTVPIEWGFQESVENIIKENPLGDNYISAVTFGTNTQKRRLEITSNLLNEAQKTQHLDRLKLFAGATPFVFQNKIYRCEEWTVKRFLSSNRTNNPGVYKESVFIPDSTKGMYQISGELIEVYQGECLTALDDIPKPTILNYLNGCLSFLNTYTRDVEPFIANSNYGLRNSFHRVLGRGGYFAASSGTSEGQFLAIRACCEAFLATGNNAWKTYAENFANYLIPYLYSGEQPPINPNTLYLPHWLYNVGAAFPTKEPIAPKSINSGVFDVVVSFVNGVGSIPTGSPNFGERVSDVYIVYDGSLLWRNLYSEVIGTKYAINYWVSNTELLGARNRVTPTGTFTSTTEPAGKIVLNSNFTGNLKVAYIRWSNLVSIARNQNYDAYPVWRPLVTGESNVALDSLFWADSAYKLLYQITNNITWNRAYLANQYTIVQTTNLTVVAKWYQKSNNPEPIDYPGAQVIKVNNPNPHTVSRVTSGVFTNFVKIDVAANPGNFPSIELQNFATQAIINPTCTIYAEAGMSTPGILQLVLSLSKNAFNLTQQYIYNWKIDTANALRTANINPKDFIKWTLTELTWFPNCVENPVYVYSGSGSSSVASTEHVNITSTTFPLVHKLSFNQVTGGFAGGGLSFLGKVSPQPPRLFYRVTGQPIILRVKDGTNRNYDTILQPGQWVDKIFTWADFTFSSQNSLSNLPPSGTLNITGIEFAATVNGASTISVYWASIGNLPDVLEDYAITYKGLVKDALNASHSVYIGDYYPVNTVSNNLKYIPGAVVFTANTVNKSTESWRGQLYCGYQSLSEYYSMGLTQRITNVLQMLEDAQKDYKNKTGLLGPFTPVFHLNNWESTSFDDIPGNTFSFYGSDPNTSWAPYQYRVLVEIARYFYINPRDVKAKAILMKFLNFLDQDYLTNNTNQPLTDFPENVYPQRNYQEPHAAALILRTALYANLAGCSPATTFRIIKKNWDYLETEYVSSGSMTGSFSLSQPIFNTVHRQFFGFWHMEIIETLSLLYKHRDSLNIPSCDQIF